MRILAIETSETAGSVALLQDERLLAERGLETRQRTAQSLAPAAQALLASQDWQPRDVELVAVTAGPGSFTGLRIGVTFAKTFAYAVGCQILGVNTLEAIARRAPADVPALWAVLDAQRQQVFVAQFAHDAAGGLVWQRETQIMEVDAWLEQLAPGMAVSGSGLKKIAERIPPGVTLLDAALWQPTAAAVGALAWRDFFAGRRDDPFTLVPQYFRRTAAEEQWECRAAEK